MIIPLLYLTYQMLYLCLIAFEARRRQQRETEGDEGGFFLLVCTILVSSRRQKGRIRMAKTKKLIYFNQHNLCLMSLLGSLAAVDRPWRAVADGETKQWEMV